MAKVSGRVMLPGNEPAQSATVEVLNSAADVVDQVVVDDQGAFRYHLAPGNWQLNAYDPHGRRGGAQINLGDDDQEVTLDLV